MPGMKPVTGGEVIEMRTVRATFVTILVLVGAIVLAIFAVGNVGTISVTFARMRFPLPVWWIEIGSALIGFVMALLLMLPGRVATGWRARGLLREHERKDITIAQFREERDRLQAENARLMAERDGLLTEREQLRARVNEQLMQTPGERIASASGPVNMPPRGTPAEPYPRRGMPESELPPEYDAPPPGRYPEEQDAAPLR